MSKSKKKISIKYVWGVVFIHRAKNINQRNGQVEVRTKKIEMDVNQKKMEYINYAYNEEITYWKKAALARVLNESEEKDLVD